MWWIPVVEGHNHLFTGLLFSLQNGFAFLFIRGHGLFGNNVCTHFHSLDNKFMMRRIHGRNDEGIRFQITHHLFKVCKRWTGESCHLLEGLKAAGVNITEPDKLYTVFIGFLHIFRPHAQRTNTGTNNGNSHFRWRCFSSCR